MQLPVAHISKVYPTSPARPRDGISIEALGRLVDGLAGADVRTPAVSGLLRGKLLLEDLERPVLLTLSDCRLRSLAHWADQLAATGYTSVLGCSCSELDGPDQISRQDAPLLTGHGIVLASRGLSGRPLVDLSLQELRRELTESRERLSKLAGYSVRLLMPVPTAFGHAVDGLVLEEAKRAGYRLVLQPGRAVTDISAQAGQPVQALQYRTVCTDDSPTHLRDWVVGRGLARGLARVRELVNRPRRILGRFGVE
ncbi:MAG: hypothetical protein ACLFVJ_07985 [Persicimonas sp.]